MASNHASFLDPMLLGVASSRILNFAARDSLFKNMFFGRLIFNVGAFPIKRSSSDLSAIRESVKRLRGNYGLVVFPEGTRSPDGQLQSQKRGFVMLAVKAGVPIVPAKIIGSYRAWGKKSRMIKPAKIKVIFGEPLYLDNKPDYNRIAQSVFAKIKLLC